MADAEYRVADLQHRGWLLVEDGNHGEYRPRSDEFGNGEFAFIRAADMDGGRVLFDQAERINATARARIRKGVGAPGDVLFSHKGTVGKVAFVSADAPPFVCSPQTTFWRTLDEQRIDRRYLYYFLCSAGFTEQWEARKDETDMAAYVSLSRWAALAAAAGAKERVAEVAGDLLAHFIDRAATLKGKAMVVAMTRANCVRLHDALRALPNCPEIKVVMTGDLGNDPKDWSAAGHLTTKKQREAIKKRMIDPDDPLKMVIVCDMWLTGTDIPCLHTLYVDKPMQGHNMIQAISRVNRVFRDKPHGLIVDYIGIGDELREAANRYSQGGGEGEPAPDIEEKARPLFFQCLDEIRRLLPSAQAAQAPKWRSLSRIDLEDLYAFVYGFLAEMDEHRDKYLQAELRLTSAFLLVKHLDDCRVHADEMIFYQRVRNQLSKVTPGRKPKRDLEVAVRDLVDDAVESDGVVDIFKSAGIEKADVSILDDQFLQTFKDRKHENLRLKLLEQLLFDEIHRRQKRNLAKAKSFRELLEKTLQRYHGRIIDAAAVVQEMIKMRQEMEAADARARQLNLGEDELAFYDAVSENYETVYEQPFLRDLVHEVVQTIKSNLKIDWTEPHRDDVRAAIRTAVRRILRRRNVNAHDFEPFMEKFMAQAEALYAEWPLAA